MFRELQAISLLIDGQVATSAVFTRMIHGTVSRMSEKAIQIELRDRKGTATIWFPKSAIKVSTSQYGTTLYALKNWFRPDSYQWRTIERFESIGGVSAA